MGTVTEKNVITVKESLITEPTFHFDPLKGRFSFILPGNKNHEGDEMYFKPPSPPLSTINNYKEGDTIFKPPGGGRGGSAGSTDGEGEDDFQFILTPSEWEKLFLDDLELPNREELIKDESSVSFVRAGYTMLGTPANMALIRSMKNSLGRRIGLHRPKEEELEELEDKLVNPFLEEDEKAQILFDIETMKSRMENIPWIDPFDVRYNNYIKDPKPRFQAVMFCLMDCSASMTEHMKDLAKRFYIYLYRFLRMKYDKVEVVFIRHTHHAEVVDEKTFFYSPETGGTIVSTAMIAMLEEIKNKYPPTEWNIYAAQCSDGDNSWNDNDRVSTLMTEQILPIISYYAYIETARSNDGWGYGRRDSDLWQFYFNNILKQYHRYFDMKKVTHRNDIYPVFRQLFSSKERIS